MAAAGAALEGPSFMVGIFARADGNRHLRPIEFAT
jgi:hypothetical protein